MVLTPSNQVAWPRERDTLWSYIDGFDPVQIICGPILMVLTPSNQVAWPRKRDNFGPILMVLTLSNQEAWPRKRDNL